MIGLLLFIQLVVHPIYISTAEWTFSAGGEWQGTIKIFYDDLEDALQNQDGIRPTLTREKMSDHIGSIERYIKSHFRFSQGSKYLDFESTSITREADVITLGLRGIDRWNPTALIVEVTLLLELFETQKNIVTIKCNGQNDFFYLKKGVTQQSISLLE